MQKILLLAVPALALLAACTKTEVKPAQTEPQQISYLALVNRQSSKALIDNTDYPISETFGTFAYFNAEGTTFPASAALYIPESEVKNATSATTGTAWTTDPAYYWPKQGSLTFFSYSPYSINASVDCNTVDGIKITGWDVDANQTVDVMVADYKKEQTKNDSNAGYSGVSTVFRHKLSQIVKFTFKTDKDYLNGHDGTASKEYVAGDKKFFINSVAINKLDYAGTYVSTNAVSSTALGSWTVTNTDNKSYTWYEQAGKVESGNNANIFGDAGTEAKANKLDGSRSYLLVLPQDFAKPTGADKDAKNIRISYTISTYNGTDWVDEEVKDVYASLWAVQGGKGDGTGTGTGNDKAESWVMNKKISYTITIGLNQIYWAPSVVDWEDLGFTYTIE